MSKSDTASTLRRMLELLGHLPRNGAYMSSRDLLEKLLSEGNEVEKRTVERDLKLLAEVFAPNIECNDKSRPYGWRWKDGRALEGVGLSVTEALSLQVIEDTLKPLLPASVLKTLLPRFKLARKTLAELSHKNRQAAWVEKVRNVQPSMPLVPPKVDGDVLAVVHECLLHDESLTGEYQSAGKAAAKAVVLSPLALVQYGAVTYLVATTPEHAEVRIYALHRLRRAKRNYELAQRPTDFNIDAYIAAGNFQFGDSNTTGIEIKLEAQIAKWLAGILRETPLSSDQTLTQLNDQNWRVTATVRDTRQLQLWVMSQGVAMRVIRPGDLRKRIAASLRAAADAYSNENASVLDVP